MRISKLKKPIGMLLGTIVLFVLLAFNSARSETPTKRLFSAGSWSLYTMPMHVATDGASGVIIVDAPICTAQIGSEEKLVFRVIYFFDGVIVTQVGSSRWDFRRTYGKVSFRAGNITLTHGDAFYAESYVERSSRKLEAEQVEVLLSAMARSGADKIEVLDRKGRVIARIPTAGMDRVLKRAKKCANKY